MKKIFISYRRFDSYETNRLASSLKNEYGDIVFLDHKSISGGDKWPDAIKKAVENATVLMVIIGKNWLFMQDEVTGKRRIDMENDWVRKEIVTFLNRRKENSDLLVLPILIDGAKMPNKEFLDAEINELCDFNALDFPNTMSTLDLVQIKSRLAKAKIYSFPPIHFETPLGGIPPDPLTQAQEDEFLKKYKSWTIRETEKADSMGEMMRELYRVFTFNSYDDAWEFMSTIHAIGIKPSNHHPRWQNAYNRVEVWLCTSNTRHQPSTRDLRLAKIMESTWQQFAKKKHVNKPARG